MGFPIIDGFDLYASTSSTIGLYNQWINGSNGGSITLIAGRFGGQAIRMTDGSGATTSLRRYFDPISQFACGQAIRLNNMGSLGNQPFAYFSEPAGHQLTLYLEGTGTVRLYRGAGATLLLTSATGLIKNGQWHYYEVIGVMDQVAGWVELWIDGALIGRFDGDTCQTANSIIDHTYIYTGDHSGSGSSADRDDFYLSDTAVRVGEARIETVRPVADTVQKQFTPQAGTDNFAMVDDATVAITDYVESDTVGHTDLYAMGDIVGVPSIIHAVKPIVAARKTDVGVRSLSIVTDSGGTLSEGAGQPLLYDGDMFDTPGLTVNPSGGAAWDAAAVNALKVGVKVAA